MTAMKHNLMSRRLQAVCDVIPSMSARTIGITGGMGSGKSVAASFLGVRLAAAVISADQVCRQLLRPGASGWQLVKQEFGREYFNPDDSLDRCKLRRTLFNDQRIRTRLNELLHPLVHHAILQEIRHNVLPGKIVLVEVPLLYEANWQMSFDRIVLIYARHEQCLARVMRRDACSRQEAEKALASQWPLADKVWWAHHVVDNSSSLADTYLQLGCLGNLLLAARKT